MDDGAQAVVRFLSDPASYGAPGPVDCVQTHCAIVFLTGTRAFKLKKPVRFSYLDFTTCQARHQALIRELELNAPLAPMIYRGLVPITRDEKGRLHLGGAGETVDWVLEMTRFGQEARLDHVAERGALTAPLCEALADSIHAAHAQAGIHREGLFGGTAGMARRLESNAIELARFAGSIFDAGRVQALDAAARAALARHRALLERRAQQGFVRRCHGDLHLGNAVLIAGCPVLFDALEFSEDIGTIDVLYDLAFLLMDLVERDLRAAACRIFNRYFDRVAPSDAAAMHEGLALMPLFLSCRAAIRAHVEANQAALKPDGAARARSYFAAAERYLLSPPPRLVAIGGFSGAGKSTLAYRAAPALGRPYGARVLRSDALRKALYGVAPEVALPEEAYASTVSAQVYDMLFSCARAALRAGETVLLDAVFQRPEDRDRAEQVATQMGAPFTGVWLDAPGAVMARRIGARHGDASDATPAVLARQQEAGTGPMRWPRLETEPGIEAVLPAFRALLG